ncbi:DNA-(apurinic or apyrimidinic site) lyase [Parasphaerochaeta coccoides DSM 17374]|uniref:DNA-(Apurinic or apyrimidinic site) lyase n=2 Tax=Parasphaerochaeta TaxID=3062336 RepID=F4GLY1_PARC1|nr:DNA-(apurinic or apyrimidinic site) lyase [Parasphaerochaeta coccoides DSM 17374]
MKENKKQIMDEKYWEDIFHGFSCAITGSGETLHGCGTQSLLPSVSQIAEEDSSPFRVLIATLISLRTKDAVTYAASRRLFSVANTPRAMLALSQEQIETAIAPAGFFRTKARNILEISKKLVEEHGGLVPPDKEALVSLPGVGTKTANLTLNLGFGIDAICVDCHVHTIANRTGWVSTKNPEQTEKELEKILPRRFWIPLNELLVSYGQKICTSVSPRCSICPIASTCPCIGVKKSR